MNATQLLAHFDRLAEAPDAVPRLRRFILDLAVRGKLVEQDAGDEPAEELLKRLTSGMKKPTKNHGVAATSEPPEHPDGWAFARFSDVLTLEYGDNLPAERRSNSGEFPVYGSNGVVGSHHEAFVHESCIVVGRKGSAGALNLCLAKGCCVTDVAYYCVPPVGLDLQYTFNMFHTIGLDTLGKGIKPGLSRSEAYELLVPIPPLAEQHRIVAKVDELMTLCGQLEAAQQERERRRDRLAAASLQRLNQPAADTNPEAQREHARFHLSHLPRLATRPEHIKAMRQTFLNLAVRGKLLEQDANDEPATELLKRIQVEKARMAKLGRIKVEKVAESIEQTGGIVPSGWALCRWNSIAMKIGDIDHKMPDTVSGGVPYVSPRDFYPNNVIDFDGAKRISREDYLRLAAKIKPDLDDLIYPRYGTIGENRLVTEQREFLASYSCAVVKTLTGFVDPKYQYIFSISGYCKDQAKAAENKTTQANVGIASIQQYIVPLPPLAEQHRIVAKVDQLMALCDRLETQLTTIQTDSRRLLEAVLQQALTPVH